MTPSLPLPGQPTLPRQIVQLVLDAVSAGKLNPGDRLIESELAAAVGASRVPVREAIRLLESYGLTVVSPFKGAQLIEVTEAETRDYFVLREAIEREALREALARPDTPERWQPLMDVVAAGREAVAVRDNERMFRICYDFHAALFTASGNSVMQAIWVNLAPRAQLIWGFIGATIDNLRFQPQHEALLDAVLAGDLNAALAALRRRCSWEQMTDLAPALEAALKRRAERPRQPLVTLAQDRAVQP